MESYLQIEYDEDDIELYKTNGFGGTDADLDNTIPVDDTDGYTSDINITIKMGCTVYFKFLASGSVDDLVLTLYKRSDSTWTTNSLPIKTITVPNDGSEDIYSFELDMFDWKPGHYRFSSQSSGGTNTFDIDIEARFWRMKNSDT